MGEWFGMISFIMSTCVACGTLTLVSDKQSHGCFC